jgi:tetratricopeptide (TPR) repeat protein
LRILLLGALCLLSEAQAQPNGVPLSCAAAPQSRSIELPRDGSDLHLRISAGPAWLEIEEAGQRVALPDAPAEAVVVPHPLRYGWLWLPVDAGATIALRRLATRNHAPAQVRASLHCSATPELLAQVAWLRRAGEVGASLDTPSDAEHLAQSLAAIRKLDDDAPGPLQHAIALHFTAELLAANGRSKEAITAFAASEQAWIALHDRDRALTAQMGRIERLYAIDQHQAVLEQTPDPANLRGPQSYFATRLENPRCLSLQSLGRRDEAASCFDWMLTHYRALDEIDDYLVVANNYANVQRDRGNLQSAQEISERSLALVSGPNAPMLRGRLRLTLADLAMRRGQIARAFTDAELALSDFEQGQFDDAIWQGSTLMFTASLYNQVGAHQEALGALGDAVRILVPLNAPSRMAGAMNVYADIETNLQHYPSAMFWRRAAEETYLLLDLQPGYQSTRAARLGLQGRLGDYADIAREVADHPPTDPLHKAQQSLLAADLALHEDRLEDGRRALDRAAQLPLSLRDQIRLALLDAKYRDRSGDGATVPQALLAGARHVDALARRAGNPTLAYVIARQSVNLRNEAFRIALGRPDADSAIEAIWQWLAFAASDAPGAASVAREAAEPFDRAVAADLLSPLERAKPTTDMAAQRELLTLLAQPEKTDAGSSSGDATATLADFRQLFDADSAFVAFIDGGTGGALLWVTRDAARLVATAAPDQVRAGAVTLRDLVRSAGSPVADVGAASQRLSKLLLGAIPAAKPPRHLYVLADEPATGIPWSVLQWPNHTEPLVESTAVSFVHLARVVDAARSAKPAALNVFVAAQSHTDPRQLRNLANASVEAAQIQDALGDGVLRVDENAQATRSTVLAALEQAGAWLHIAAHGMAQPQRIGYAGIWLEPPAAEAAPAFLSWLDVLDSGVRADLVVLDACQLGDSGSAVSGNLSFADAVSRAGARRVVAALWPVSDAASALWVPAFYRSLLADAGYESALALRTAQLRLRASRAFTHPFFWAGLQSIERLDLPVPPRKAR